MKKYLKVIAGFLAVFAALFVLFVAPVLTGVTEKEQDDYYPFSGEVISGGSVGARIGNSVRNHRYHTDTKDVPMPQYQAARVYPPQQYEILHVYPPQQQYIGQMGGTTVVSPAHGGVGWKGGGGISINHPDSGVRIDNPDRFYRGGVVNNLVGSYCPYLKSGGLPIIKDHDRPIHYNDWHNDNSVHVDNSVMVYRTKSGSPVLLRFARSLSAPPYRVVEPSVRSYHTGCRSCHLEKPLHQIYVR